MASRRYRPLYYLESLCSRVDVFPPIFNQDEPSQSLGGRGYRNDIALLARATGFLSGQAS